MGTHFLCSSFLTPTGIPYSWTSSCSSPLLDSPRGELTPPVPTVPCPSEMISKTTHGTYWLTYPPTTTTAKLDWTPWERRPTFSTAHGTQWTLGNIYWDIHGTEMDIHPKRKALVNLRSPLVRKAALLDRPILHLESVHNIHMNISLNIYLKHYFFALPLLPFSEYISHTFLLLFFPNLPSFLPLAILNICKLKRNNVIPIHKNLIKPLNK